MKGIHKQGRITHAVISGIIVGLFTLLIRIVMSPVVPSTLFDLLGGIWMVFGGFALGFIPIFIYDRFGVVTPIIVVGLSYAAALLFTAIRYLNLAESDAAMSASPSWLTLYLIGWLIPILLALMAGTLEFKFGGVSEDSTP